MSDPTSPPSTPPTSENSTNGAGAGAVTGADPASEVDITSESGPGSDDAPTLRPPPDTEPTASSEPPSLEEQLEAAKEKTTAVREKMLRVAADFENFRKRSQRDVTDSRRRGMQSTVRELLPMFDNLERAMAAVTAETDVEGVVAGINMVIKQFGDGLKKLEMERVKTVGEMFDPQIHDSIQYVHSDEHAPGVVTAELQGGYRMGKDLIRPAMVVVSRGSAPTDAAGEESAEGAPAPTDTTADTTAEASDGEAAPASDADSGDGPA